ncbi:hypothetical protein VNO77_07716 [Canavalia gladiata]|uniref:Uncharacterized protein n=1 Tax=Canavalia gladiata TaxID=3824 RepID=A0AAN9M8T0_CANGL
MNEGTIGSKCLAKIDLVVPPCKFSGSTHTLTCGDLRHGSSGSWNLEGCIYGIGSKYSVLVVCLCSIELRLHSVLATLNQVRLENPGEGVD